MSRGERHDLYCYWTQQRSNDLIDKIIKAWDSHQKTVREVQSITQEQQLRCLLEAKVIGVTTTGLARNLDVLRRLQSRVLVNEEAGEVLEAHTLTALLPTIQHAILIGDHEQLRPQVKTYELRQDHPQGAQYSLDISLFERLVRPKFGNPVLQYTALKTQRRMYPSIADLIRNTIYAELEDHPTVSLFPPVTGMQKRLFWLNHNHTEESFDPMFSKQFFKTNDFEVQTTSALVSHLVRQGTYPPGDIAVLTPYLGQLQKLKRLLSSSFDIVMSDRDIDDMRAQGFDLTSIRSEVQSSINKSSLLNAVMIATVDNFQGEEAKVIILSFVRSNEARKCGFLNSSNRINVALSRARHGMFIIGNATTATSIPMWSQIISMLEQSGNFGDSLPLLCPRHPDKPIEVRTPDDFARFSPEGGCDRKCISRLPCGHACPNKCHSETLHNSVFCLERCQRTKAGCEHACPKPCGAPCDLKCQIPLPDVLLPCGHSCTTLECYKAQKPNQLVKCQAKLEHIMSGCNHKVLVQCHEIPIGDDYDCSAICGAYLRCGHNCKHPCKLCKPRRDGLIAETAHGECRMQCDRPYGTCRHSCKSRCHNRNPADTFPICKEPCDVRCIHSKCNKRCNEPCVPCVEPCPWSCPHGKCQMPCAVPCDRPPCSERCHQVLPYGHRYPSLCGETCSDPSFCQLCGNQSIKSMVVDYIEMLTYGEIDLDANPCIIPDCGHIITLENLDGLMSMKEFYEYDERGETITGIKSSSEPFSISGQKNCPSCRGPLRNINRYGRITRRAWIDEATKKFIVWANAKFVPLAAQVKAMEEELKSLSELDTRAIQSSVSRLRSSGSHVNLMKDRANQVSTVRTLTKSFEIFQSAIRLRSTIRNFFNQVSEKQQPFSQIYDLVQDARRHRGVQHNMAWMPDMLQLRHRLLASVMLMRCDYAILTTFLASCKGTKCKINVDFSHQRKDCVALINECRARNQPTNEVEGHLFFARFIALERGFTNSMPDGSEPLISARQHLDEAETLCIKYSGQTAGMASEVDDARIMLRDSTFYMPVSNEEKAQVYAAMAKDLQGTGHWYYCTNGHPFTIGECGAPMQTSRCPQCGSTASGEHHQFA